MLRIFKKYIFLSGIAIVIAGGFFALPAWASFSETISYQGKIFTSSGEAVADGNYDATFKLYTQPTGGTPIWTENWNGGTSQVSTKGGLFTVRLGTYSTLSGVDFAQTLYLGISFDGDSEFTPRTKLGMIPSAMVAGKIGGISSGQLLRSDASSTLTASSSNTALTLNQNGTGDFFDAQSDEVSQFRILNSGIVGIGSATSSSFFHVGSSGLFGVNNSGDITSITGLTGATGNFDLGSTTLTLPKHVIDNLNLIASSTRTGSSGKLVTGTAGANGECAKWDASGNITSSGAPCGAGGGGAAVAGSSSQIQFNDGGTLGASDQFVWDDASTSLGIGTDSPWAKLSLTGGDFVQRITGNPELVGSFDLSESVSNFLVTKRYIYINDSGLKIIDISDPTNPILATSTAIDASSGQTITKSGNYLYIYNDSVHPHLDIVDVTDPRKPIVVSRSTTTRRNIYAGQTMSVSGKYAFFAGGDGVDVFDITDPRQPVLVSDNPINYGLATLDLTIAGHYAYVVTGGFAKSLVVLDVSDPTNVTMVGHWPGLGHVNSVSVLGSYAYLAVENNVGLRVIDISDPTNPVKVGSYDTPGLAASLTVAGDYVYLADYNEGFEIFDISDPTAPQLVARHDTAGRAMDIDINGSYVYVLSGQSKDKIEVFHVPTTRVPTLEAGTAKVSKLDVEQDAEISGSLTVDTGLSVGGSASFQNGAGVFGDLNLSGGDFVQRITSSDDIVQVGTTTIDDSITSITISGSYAFVGGSGGHMRIYDISDKKNLVQIATTTHTGFTYGVDIFGSYAYATDQGHMRIYDISNPADPIQVAIAPTASKASAVAVSGGYAYVGDLGHLRIFDVADPNNPRQIAGTTTSMSVSSIAMSGSYIYVGDYGHMRTYDISEPATPTQVAKMTISGNSYNAIAIAGSYAYVGGDDGTDGWLRVYDISDPTDPTQVAKTTISNNSFNAIAISGSYAYMRGNGRMHIYDISDPTNPVEVAVITTTNYSYSLALSGSYLYVGDSSHLRIYKLPTTNVPTLEAGTAAFSHLSVSQATDLQGSLNVRSGLTSGGNLYAQAGLAVAGNTQLQGLVQIGTSTASTSIPTQSLVVGNGIICVDSGGDDCGNTQRTEGTIYAKSTNVTSVDLAEQYPTIDKNLEAGDIVMLDPKNPVFVERFSEEGTHTNEADFHTIESTHVGSSSTLTKEDLEEYRDGEDSEENGDNAGDFNGSTGVEPLNATTTDFHPRLLGVVSTKPGFLLGGFGGEKYQKCREDSPVGTKCADGLRKIPVALSGRIPVKVTNENGDIGPGDLIAPSPTKDGVGMKASGTSTQIVGTALEPYSKNATGTILVFAHLEYRDLDTTGSTLDFSGDSLTLSALKSVTGAWEMSKDGELRVLSITVKKKAEIPEFTIYDKESGEPYCVRVSESGPKASPGACKIGGEKMPQDPPPTDKE